jgi:hypothetical protein
MAVIHDITHIGMCHIQPTHPNTRTKEALDWPGIQRASVGVLTISARTPIGGLLESQALP